MQSHIVALDFSLLFETSFVFSVTAATLCVPFTLLEASEYVDHDILTNRFHVTHWGGCGILQGHLLRQY